MNLYLATLALINLAMVVNAIYRLDSGAQYPWLGGLGIFGLAISLWTWWLAS